MLDKTEYNPPDMTPENAQPVEPAPRGMGEFSRVTGVFFEPEKTFEDIARRPTFIVPMLLVILFAVVYSMQIGQRVGWERIARHQLEMSSRAQQLTPEQRESQVAISVKISRVAQYLGPILGVPIYDLVIAGVLLGIVAGIMSAPVKFKQVFAAVAWAGLPGILFSVLAIVVIFIKNPDDFNLSNPLAFNPGAFMDPQTGSKFVYSLASSLDLFSFWTIFLLATGLKAAAGKKLSFGGAMFSVLLPWCVVVLVKAGFSGMFG
jgi:hypothetical protein